MMGGLASTCGCTAPTMGHFCAFDLAEGKKCTCGCTAVTKGYFCVFDLAVEKKFRLLCL